MTIVIHKIWKKKTTTSTTPKREKKKKKSGWVDIRIFLGAFPLTKILLIYYFIENVTYLIKYNISINNDGLLI